MALAPKEINGKKLVFEEEFRSPFVRPTEESAQQVLDAIRNAHRAIYGWVELDARIERCADGYVAVRHHARYK